LHIADTFLRTPIIRQIIGGAPLDRNEDNIYAYKPTMNGRRSCKPDDCRAVAPTRCTSTGADSHSEIDKTAALFWPADQGGLNPLPKTGDHLEGTKKEYFWESILRPL